MMKQRGILLAGKKIALYSILALSMSLYAQQDVKKFEVMPFIGFNSFDSDSTMEDDTIFGIRGTYNIDKYYGVRLSYESASDIRYSSKYTTLATTTQKSGRTDLNRFLGEVVVSGEEEYGIVPYVFLGLGYESLSEESSYDISQGLIDAGIGFRYQAWKNINLSLEGKSIRKFDTHDFDFALSLGIGYIFGESLVHTNCKSGACNIQRPVNIVPAPTHQVVDPMFNSPIVTQEMPIINTPNMPLAGQAGPIINTQNMPLAQQAISQVEIVNNTNIIEEIVEIPMAPQQSNVYIAPISSGNYYIQMEVWYTQTKNYSLINKIKDHNLPYRLIDTMRNNRNAKLLVVGPFGTRSEAKARLVSLKTVKSDAFITKLK